MKQGTLFASESRAVAQAYSSDWQKNPGFPALHIVIAVASITSTPSVVPKIEALDYLGNVYTLLTGDAIVATGTTVLKVGRGITPVAGGAAADMVPPMFRLTMTHGDTDAITYTATYALGETVG